MKKMVFIAGALMILAAGSAMAAGTNLAWNDCVGGGGVQDRAVACTNTGSGVLYVSFNPASDIPMQATSDAFVDVVTTNPIGSWWNGGTTRWAGASGLSPSGLCPGWFDAAPSGPIAFSPSLSLINANRLRVRETVIVAAGEEQDAAPGTEYIACTITLKFNAGTLGNAECNGGAAIGIYNLNIQQPGGVADVNFGQAPDVRNCATFKGGGGQTCPAATPTKKATWGSIKALYR
jgi:hypothetical protein